MTEDTTDKFRLFMGTLRRFYDGFTKSYKWVLEQSDDDRPYVSVLFDEFRDKKVIIKIQCTPDGYKGKKCGEKICPLKKFDPSRGCYFFSANTCCFPEFDLTWN